MQEYFLKKNIICKAQWNSDQHTMIANILAVCMYKLHILKVTDIYTPDLMALLPSIFLRNGDIGSS